MKKFGLLFLSTVILVFVVIIITPASAWSDPGIVVSPLGHNFGDVELGSSSTAIITITNDWYSTLWINVYLSLGSSPDFSITSAPPPGAELLPFQSVFVEVTYSPSDLGSDVAMMDIEWTNGENGTEIVNLEGVGVPHEPPPPVSIADILAFIDASLGDGTLVGNGPGNSAEKRINALRNMIEAAGDLIEDGLYDEACQQLMDAYKKCDGLAPPESPPDFVAGPHAAELAVMIQNLRISLGCE